MLLYTMPYQKEHGIFFGHQITALCLVPDSLIHRNFNFKTLTTFVEKKTLQSFIGVQLQIIC